MLSVKTAQWSKSSLKMLGLWRAGGGRKTLLALLKEEGGSQGKSFQVQAKGFKGQINSWRWSESKAR